MNWSRTIRFDGAIDEAQRNELAAALPSSMSVRFGQQGAAFQRTYALVEGPAAIEPATAVQTIPNARWYDEAIIVLAIEPTPADALPAITAALNGAGAPAGVLECTTASGNAIVEFRPALTSAALVIHLVDVELRRFRGHRRIVSLAPLPADLTARVAADGLQAKEIAPDRILEVLLEQSRVE